MNKKIQFALMVIQAFLARHKKDFILGSLIGFLITLFIIQTYPYYLQIVSLKPQKIGIIGKFTDKTLPLPIQKQISFGLTNLTPSGEATPSLAKSWNIDGNGLTFIFNLYPDLVWHDGTKFKAGDVQYKLKDVNIIAVDDTTLKITLAEPYSPLPVLLNSPIIKDNLIGLGLHKVIRLKYSGDFISELVLSPVKPGLPTFLYKFYPNTDDAILAFKRGEVDSLQNIPYINDLSFWKKVKITEITLYDRYVGLFFNLKDNLFKEKEIRQALAYATPEIPNAEKAYTPISPKSWAYSSKIRLYRFDPDAAVKILSKSPVASDSSTITISTYPSLISTAQFIADAWNKIHISTKVKVENSIPSDYQVLLIPQAIPADPDQYQYWQSTQENTNLTHYSNLKIDKLLEDGRKTYDIDKRQKIYADFQRYLVDDAPVLFLYYPKVYSVERK